MPNYHPKSDNLLRYQGRLVVPAESELRREILEEAYKSKFTIHPGRNKMYQDVKKVFRWKNLKKDIA